MQIYDRWRKRDSATGRKIPSAHDGRGMRWEVRWRHQGAQRKKAFGSRAEAEGWMVTQGRTVAQQNAAITIGELWPGWYASKGGLKASTLRFYAKGWHRYVEPVWAGRAVASVTHVEVAAWLGSLAAQSPSVARQAFTVLTGIMRMAVRAGMVPADVTAGITAPQTPKAEVQPLTVEQVRRLADECAPHSLVVWTLAVTGIRFGEMAGLQVASLDRTRRRLRISRAVSEVGGPLIESLPKSNRRREVPLTPRLFAQLCEAADGRTASDALLPTRRGGVWSESSWSRIWSGYTRTVHGQKRTYTGARDRAGLPGVRVHDLRHTAASWMIFAGADVKAIQSALGHASATMTLDLYAHLMGDGLDDVAARLGDTLGV